MRRFSILAFGYALSVLLCTAVCRAQTSSTPSFPPETAPSVTAAPGTRIIPPPPNYTFPDGQTYVFSAEWHFFSAGSARVTLESAGTQKRVTAIANSAGVVNTFYKVHDNFEALFDPRTFCSEQVTKQTEEGSHSRQTRVHFDYERGKSVLDEKNLKTGEVRHAENDIPGCVTDLVSGFYYLASLSLQVGTVNSFQINDGGKTTEVTAHVEGREQIKVPAGTFQTVRVRAEPVSGSLKGKGTVWAWYSDDDNHTPVQMRSKLGFGTLLFRLQQVEKQ